MGAAMRKRTGRCRHETLPLPDGDLDSVAMVSEQLRRASLGARIVRQFGCVEGEARRVGVEGKESITRHLILHDLPSTANRVRQDEVLTDYGKRGCGLSFKYAPYGTDEALI